MNIAKFDFPHIWREVELPEIMKLKTLRKKYPKFIYRNYNYKISAGNLKISFLFEIPPNITFRPAITIKNLSRTFLVGTRSVLDNLVFHIGLMEMLSYWKTTCSPEIVIEAGYLDEEQIRWWKNLIIRGMGQFFYENKIDWRAPDFLRILTPGVGEETPGVVSHQFNDRYLVPFAGGRDSIVTLESLKKQKKGSPVGLRPREISLFTVNPIEKIQKAVKVSGVKKQIIVQRLVDRKLLGLNKKGYLNGHTPFTALLSFISVLCAVLFDYKNIVFSNEKSANEGNVKYLGRIINHQWAKSYEFEKMFRGYVKKYLVKNINYFSYLRKYGELEISKMFSKYKQYFKVFSSCNAGMKMSNRGLLAAKERWCGNCPKCLFVYMALYPYLSKKELDLIFQKDIFDPSTRSGQEKLLPIMKSLLGEGSHKPLECVGTYAESRKAFKLSLKKAQKFGKVPYLLR